MINLVIDTNILVSAALSSKGNPARVISLISDSKEIQLFYSSSILDEYEKVLAYKKLKISQEVQEKIIKSIRIFGTEIEPAESTIPMADESDRVFYDTAQASQSVLITGNTRHYPAEDFIMAPADFIKLWLSGQDTDTKG